MNSENFAYGKCERCDFNKDISTYTWQNEESNYQLVIKRRNLKNLSFLHYSHITNLLEQCALFCEKS